MIHWRRNGFGFSAAVMALCGILTWATTVRATPPTSAESPPLANPASPAVDELDVNTWGVWGEQSPTAQGMPDSPLAQEFGVGIVGREEEEVNLLDQSNLLNDTSGVKPDDELDLELKKIQ